MTAPAPRCLCGHTQIDHHAYGYLHDASACSRKACGCDFYRPATAVRT